eukprot:TRINITY_DN2193_c0_g3_i4.p2 TRINITY_DN2193_c0_g3~~TRINITY_DN2193_c0_g3_i4.p2  ORF type:complete len:122 (+),score=27.53 TRINITY_DN2193_c0_g3_i4:23-367(+)
MGVEALAVLKGTEWWTAAQQLKEQALAPTQIVAREKERTRLRRAGKKSLLVALVAEGVLEEADTLPKKKRKRGESEFEIPGAEDLFDAVAHREALRVPAGPTTQPPTGPTCCLC